MKRHHRNHQVKLHRLDLSNTHDSKITYHCKCVLNLASALGEVTSIAALSQMEDVGKEKEDVLAP